MSESDSAKGKGENGEQEEKDSVSCEEKMKVHRGERYLHDIQLETMVRSSIGENENNSWYSWKPIVPLTGNNNKYYLLFHSLKLSPDLLPMTLNLINHSWVLNSYFLWKIRNIPRFFKNG